jgi:hypothetical protein
MFQFTNKLLLISAIVIIHCQAHGTVFADNTRVCSCRVFTSYLVHGMGHLPGPFSSIMPIPLANDGGSTVVGAVKD